MCSITHTHTHNYTQTRAHAHTCMGSHTRTHTHTQTHANTQTSPNYTHTNVACPGGGWLAPLTSSLEQLLRILQNGLNTLNVPYSYGYSIILLTLLVKTATYPLTKKQVRTCLNEVAAGITRCCITSFYYRLFLLNTEQHVHFLVRSVFSGVRCENSCCTMCMKQLH